MTERETSHSPKIEGPELILQRLSPDARELYQHIQDANQDPRPDHGVTFRYAIGLYRSKGFRIYAPKEKALLPTAELLAAGLIRVDKSRGANFLSPTETPADSTE